jgi:hypothetical protein
MTTMTDTTTILGASPHPTTPLKPLREHHGSLRRYGLRYDEYGDEGHGGESSTPQTSAGRGNTPGSAMAQFISTTTKKKKKGKGKAVEGSGGTRMGSPTLQALQEPILLLPGSAFEVAASKPPAAAQSIPSPKCPVTID